MTQVKQHAERMKILVGVATPTAFGKKCGVNGKTIQKTLKGEITSHAVLEKISIATGKSIEWILGIESLSTNNQKNLNQQIAKKNLTIIENSELTTEETEHLPMVRQYRDLAQMDTDTLREIQTWINDTERIRPGFTGWFRLEFQNRFPEFNEWKTKIIKKQANGENL